MSGHFLVIMLRILFIVSVVTSYRAYSPREVKDLFTGEHGGGKAQGRLNYKSCECGKSKTPGFHSRVVGGQDTIPFEFPWLVFVYIREPGGKGGNNCGGTLINDRIVLTAAHCLSDKQPNTKARKARTPDRFQAVFHTYAPRTEGPDVGIPIDISELYVHPDYLSGLSDESDLGVLILSRRVDITSETFNPICIPQRTDNINLFDGRDGVVAGWGVTSRGRPPDQPKVSQKLKVPIHSNEYCKQWAPDKDYSRVICADDHGPSGAGKGDSGGPLFIDLPSKHWMQIGVVSVGTTLVPSDPQYYTRQFTYYARLTRLLPWIDQVSWELQVNWCRRPSVPR